MWFAYDVGGWRLRGIVAVLCAVNGGGHEWFRLPALDTTSVIWDFVSRRFSAAA